MRWALVSTALSSPQVSLPPSLCLLPLERRFSFRGPTAAHLGAFLSSYFSPRRPLSISFLLRVNLILFFVLLYLRREHCCGRVFARVAHSVSPCLCYIRYLSRVVSRCLRERRGRMTEPGEPSVDGLTNGTGEARVQEESMTEPADWCDVSPLYFFRMWCFRMSHSGVSRKF